jgi:hypothetical protein
MVKAGMDVSGDLGKADDEKEFFKKGSIMKTRNKENCEFFHRIGMAMCLSPSSFHTGCECLANRVAKPDDVDANEKAKKTGLLPLLELLETPEGDEECTEFFKHHMLSAIENIKAGQTLTAKCVCRA